MLDKGTFRAQANPFAGIPEPDWGPTQTFFNSIGPSFQMSFSGTGVRAGKYFLADALDGDAITAEEFKEQYAYPGGPQWMPGMTRSRAELMVSDYLDDVMAESEISPERNPVSAIAGGFAGQALDPINYIGPGLARAGTALAASKNFAVAGTGRAANVLGTAINPGTRYFNAEAKLMSFAQQAKLRLAETAINGTAEALWQVGGINAFTEYTQQNYGAKDFVADLFGAPIIASAFGIGRAAWGRLSPDTRSIISDRVTRMAANGEIRPEEIKAVLATDPEGQRILAEREARLAQLESDSTAAVEQGNATVYAQPPPFVDEFGYINRVWSEVGEELARAADENAKLAAGWAGGDIPPAVLEAKIAADRAKAAFEKLQTERMGRALMGEEIGDEFDLIAKTLRESGASEPVLNKLAELGQSRPAVVDATTRRPVGLTTEQLTQLARDTVDRGEAVTLPNELKPAAPAPNAPKTPVQSLEDPKVRRRVETQAKRGKALSSKNEAQQLRIKLLEKHAKNAAQKKKAGTLTTDESWLADLYQKAFGVEVRFFDENVSRQLGALGVFFARDPRTIYVRSGALFGGRVDSMMTIAGHEVSHSLSVTSPVTWLAMSDAIVAAGVNPVVRDAYVRTKTALEGPDTLSLWTSMSPGQKIDEVFAAISGRAMQTTEFWEALWTSSPTDARILHATLQERVNRLDSLPAKTPKRLKEMVRSLGAAAALARSTSQRLKVSERKGLIYATHSNGPKYGARHWDFLLAVNADLNAKEMARLMDKGGTSLADVDARMRDLVGIVDETTLDDRSGSPLNFGDYDIRPWSFTVDESQANWDTVLRYRIIQQVFSKAAPESLEGQIFAEWSALGKNQQLSESPRLLAKYLENPERNGLLLVIKGKNGRYRVGLLRNDLGSKAVRTPLNEIDKALKKTLRSKVLQGLDEDFQSVERSLRSILWAMRTRESGLPDAEFAKLVAKKERELTADDPSVEASLLREFFNSDLALDVMQEWRRMQTGSTDFASRPDGMRVVARSMEDNVFDALLAAFREFTTEKASAALLRSDLKEFRSIRDLNSDIDILQQHRNKPDEWKDVLKKWKNEPKLQERLKELMKKDTFKESNRAEFIGPTRNFPPEQDPKALQDLIRVREQEITREIKESMILLWMSKNDIFEHGTVADYDAVWKQFLAVNPDADKILAAMVKDKLQEFVPGFERATKLNDELNAKAESYEAREWKESGADDNDPLSQRVDENSGLPSEESMDDGVRYMARLADEAPEAAAVRALESAVKDEQQQATTLRRLSQTAADSLKRDREYFGGWNKSYAAKASSHITSLAESFGITGFKLDAGYAKLQETFKKEPPKLNERTQPVFEALMEAVKHHESRTASLIKLAKFGKITESAPGEVNDLLVRNYRRLENFEQAVAATNDDLIRQSGSTIITLLRDAQAKEGLFGLARNGFAHVKNFLDGLAYKGTQMRTDSVAMHRIVSRERAQGRLVTLLEEINQEIPGFRDQWLNNQHTRNLELHRQGAYTGPDHVKKVYDRILQRLDEVNEALVGEANSLGANIRLLDGYIWSQTHRADLIRSAGRAAFIRDLGSMVDVAKMQKHHGPDWSFSSWAEQFYHEVTDPSMALRNSYDPDQVGNNLADPNGRHRTIFFKPGSAFDYDMKYGSRHTASAITAQLGMRAEKLGLMQMMGTNYDKNWGEFVATLGGVGPKFHDMWVADLTYRQIAGQLDHPYDVKLAAYGRAVRNWMNSAVGWMAGIASLPDMGNLASQLRFMGGPDALRHRSVLDAMMKNGSSQGERTMWLRGNGAGLTALVQSYSRILDADGWFVNTAEKLSNLTFKYNGLEVMNRAVQGAYFDISTQILGDNVKAQTPAFKNWLAQSGISEGEWAQMAKHADKVDGLENVRLSPEMIPDTALSRKLAMAMRAGMDYALIQPSSSTEALLRMGTQSGTWTGEAMRTVMQFKSYPVDMVRRIVRRFNNGFAQNALTERMIWASTMIGLSVAALSLKDMARGNEPLNPFDGDQWNWHNILRVAEQATVGPFAMMGQLSNMQQAAGPAVGGVLDVLTSDTAYGRTSAAFDLTPFSTAWTGPRRSLMALVMPETFGEPIQAMYDWRRITTGQGRLLESD